MLEKILKLQGIQKLSKNEQQLIQGQQSIKGQGPGDLLACRCPDTGELVVGHADNCTTLTSLLCPSNS